MSVAGETDEGGLQLVSDKSVQRIKEKTEIALLQKQFVDELVDFRVKMQNLLVLVNRLPQGTLRNEFVNKNKGIADKVKEIETGIVDVVDNVLKSDNAVASKVGNVYADQSVQEAIQTSQDGLDPKDGNHFFGLVDTMIRHKRGWEETTVDHWNKLAQVQSGKTLKLNALNKSIFDQVASILEDNVRWRKRCTVLRGGYQIVGETANTDEDGYVRNPSVYDDQEFYNSLLNQYASLSMNRNATVIKQRQSKKKEIHRKASKGRRMIFTVHPKLQNFCAPEKYPPTDIDVDQLFSSLFGKNTSMSDSFVHSEDSGRHLRIEPESDDMIARKSSSSSYLFHYPTPHPLPSYRQSDSRLSTPDSDMILSSSTSVNELYNPDHVFSFDEQSVYSQHPTYVSTAIEESPSGYLQRDNSYVKEMAGEIEAEKVEVIDEYMCILLRRVKEEAKLSEVEYGRLLTHIECGEVSDVCNVIEDVLASHDYTPIYQIIYPIKDESLSVPGSVENEEEYVSSRIYSAAPIHITDIGLQHLPPVFIYKGLLCGEGLMRVKKAWNECFVVIATDSISVYSNLQAWRLRNPPLVFISLCSTMSVSEGMDHEVRYLKLEDLNKSSSRVLMKWKKHVIVLEIGSHNATIERFFSEAINRDLSVMIDC